MNECCYCHCALKIDSVPAATGSAAEEVVEQQEHLKMAASSSPSVEPDGETLEGEKLDLFINDIVCDSSRNGYLITQLWTFHNLKILPFVFT